MKFNLEFVLGIGYIALMIGVGWASIGTMPNTEGPYPWYMPVAMGVTVGFPFYLGFLAGKNK